MPDFTFSGGSTTRLIPVELAVSANHTITDVDPRTNEWTAPDGGKVIYYRVNIDTQGSKEVSVGRKEGTPAPKVGDVLFGVVEETARGLKFKSVKPGGGGNWGPKKDDPDQRRSIERQVSAKCVTELVVAGVVPISEFRRYTDAVANAIEGK